MRYSRFSAIAASLLLAVAAVAVAGFAQAPKKKADYPGVGTPASPQELQGANLSIATGPSGKGLPEGSGTAKQGEPLFAARCSMCHGQDAEGYNAPVGTFSPLRGPRLGGGNSTPHWPDPADPMAGKRITTLSYYVPYSSQIYNTVAAHMPMFKPGSLKADEVYALTAFVLFKNGIIKEDDVMNRETLPKVVMPNRHGMVPDALEDIPNIQKRGCFETYGFCP